MIVSGKGSSPNIGQLPRWPGGRMVGTEPLLVWQGAGHHRGVQAERSLQDRAGQQRAEGAQGCGGGHTTRVGNSTQAAPHTHRPCDRSLTDGTTVVSLRTGCESPDEDCFVCCCIIGLNSHRTIVCYCVICLHSNHASLTCLLGRGYSSIGLYGVALVPLSGRDDWKDVWGKKLIHI